jgi:hypothetical protein
MHGDLTELSISLIDIEPNYEAPNFITDGNENPGNASQAQGDRFSTFRDAFFSFLSYGREQLRHLVLQPGDFRRLPLRWAVAIPAT